MFSNQKGTELSFVNAEKVVFWPFLAKILQNSAFFSIFKALFFPFLLETRNLYKIHYCKWDRTIPDVLGPLIWMQWTKKTQKTWKAKFQNVSNKGVWRALSGIASNHPLTIFFQSRVHIYTYILQAKVSYDLNHFEPTLMLEPPIRLPEHITSGAPIRAYRPSNRTTSSSTRTQSLTSRAVLARKYAWSA